MSSPTGPIKLNFLLDTGSQVSIVDYDKIKNSGLQFEKKSLSLHSLSFKDIIEGFDTSIKLLLPNGSYHKGQFFGLPNFKINMHSNGISKLNSKLDKLNCLSTCVPKYSRDNIKINGIIGSDILAAFSVFELTKVAEGTCVRLANGFVPIGCIDKFNLEFKNVYCDVSSNDKKSDHFELNCSNKFQSLEPRTNLDEEFVNKSKGKKVAEIKLFKRHLGECKSKSKFKKCKKVFKCKYAKQCNFVLNEDLRPKHFSVSQISKTEEDVEVGLEKLFSLESIGIPCEHSLEDLNKINEFRNNIKFVNGKFHVSIPWDDKLLARVPSNFLVAKHLAKKVHFQNVKEGIDSQYLKVFDEQLNLGIIEEIFPVDTEAHKWIPHRPVVRVDPLVKSTKVRPVFNCSLRNKGAPSLNDAAYPGVDLLNPLLGLLNYIRTNNFALLADIKKAFLNIFLSDNTDRNKFSFILYYDNKFHFFRHNTILFGFVASPFILGCVLRNFAETLYDRELKAIIQNQFYVDNMLVTSNSST